MGFTWARGLADRPPLVLGSAGRQFGAALRGVVFALFRPCDRRFRLLLLRSLCLAFLSALWRLRWFRFTFLALRLALGLLAVAVVSLR